MAWLQGQIKIQTGLIQTDLVNRQWLEPAWANMATDDRPTLHVMSQLNEDAETIKLLLRDCYLNHVIRISIACCTCGLSANRPGPTTYNDGLRTIQAHVLQTCLFGM